MKNILNSLAVCFGSLIAIIGGSLDVLYSFLAAVCLFMAGALLNKINKNEQH